MALKPEPMQRVAIVSSKGYQRPVIETLHALRAAHLVDFKEDREGEFAEFRIGRPLSEGQRASEKIVRVRALMRALLLEGHVPATRFTAGEITERLETTIFQVEQDVTAAAEGKARLDSTLESLVEEEGRLRPLGGLPLAIEDYHGYESLAVFLGTTPEPVEGEIRRIAAQSEVVAGPEGLVVAFVPKAQETQVADLLFRSGFKELPAPSTGTGPVAERLAAIAREREALAGKLVKAEEELSKLRTRYGDFLVAAEEHLAIEVAKSEAPLSFASTENAFIVTAWVPGSEAARVRDSLVAATAGNLHFQMLGSAHEHHHTEGASAQTSPQAHHEEKEEDQPPTLMRNAGPVRPFQFFTQMFSTPKYEEIDPTVVLAIAFPLFFGFMIGDLGLGLVMVALGALLLKKMGHVEGLKELGFAIVVAGVVAAAVGGFVFKDAFGIPFGFTHHMEEELEHAHVALACTPEVYHHLGETTWGCLLGGQLWHAEPIVGKVTDVKTMLLLSLAAGFVHLGVGILFGIKNEWGHGAKHTAAKLGWLLLFLTFFPAVVALIDAATWTAISGMTANQAYMLAGGGFLVGAVILGWAEGVVGVLEIPSMLSNILSYLRLGAVAVAKGAMAIAFNKLTLVDIGLSAESALLLLVGFVAFLFVQVLLFVLGVLSSGIQAIRLNYVEFFTKFYKGGGKPFAPFGQVRKYSTS